MPLSSLPCSPAVVQAEFPLSPGFRVSPYRPLCDLADIALKDIYEGLLALTDKRLCYGLFKVDKTCCAVGVGMANHLASRESGISVQDLVCGPRDVPEEANATIGWIPGNWSAVSGRVNDKFGQGGNCNHPTIQKARYAYVLGVVTSEMILRGFLG